MKKKMKRPRAILPIMAGIFVCILMLAFIIMPFPASGLTIRLYFGDFTGDSLQMYYTTDTNPLMGPEQICTAAYDAENKLAVIKLSPELADHITQIRFDFPETNQVLSVTNISFSSAGIIQRHCDPCDFFEEDNIIFKNSIPQIDLVESRKTAYIQTSGPDPYLVFSHGLLADMLQYRSSFRKSRAAACILLVLGYVSYHIGLFGSKEDSLICQEAE